VVEELRLFFLVVEAAVAVVLVFLLATLRFLAVLDLRVTLFFLFFEGDADDLFFPLFFVVLANVSATPLVEPALRSNLRYYLLFLLMISFSCSW
jgi:hypothetical protein